MITVTLKNIKHFDLLIQRCLNCKHKNILGFCGQIDWQIEGSMVIFKRKCAKCGNEFIRKEFIKEETFFYADGI